MADGCSPDNLGYGVLPGSVLSQGRVHNGRGWSDELAAKWEEDNRIYIEFEKARFHLQYGDTKRATNMELAKEAYGDGKTGDFKTILDVLGPKYALAPTEVLPKKFMDPIAKRMRDFNRTYGADSPEAYKAAWKEKISPMAESVQQELIRAANTLPGDELDRFLKDRYGMKREDVNLAMDHLEWWRQGGPTIAMAGMNKGQAALKKLINNASGAMARFNVLWTVYNVGDMGRIASAATFKSPTAGVLPVLKAAIKTARSGAFTPVKELGRVQAGDFSREYATQWFDPFHASTVLQKNFAYHLDKELGGDGFGLLSSHVFDYENWNVPSWHQTNDPLKADVFKLGRYMLAESLYLRNTTARALGFGNGTAAERVAAMPQAAAELAMYMGTRAILFGVEAVIPAELALVLKNAMGEDKYKEMVATINQAAPLNLVGKATQAGLDAVFGENVVKENIGANTSVSFVQVPILGVGLKAFSSMMEKLDKETVESVQNIASFTGDEPLPAKAAQLAGVASAAMNLTGYMPLINNTTNTKMLFAISDAMGDPHNYKKGATGIAKAFLGYNAARQAKKSDTSIDFMMLDNLEEPDGLHAN